MKRCILSLSLALSLAAAADSAHAQFFFKKTKAPDPAQAAVSERQKIADAMFVARNDPDERKRTRALQILESADAKAYPEVATLLADMATKDPQPHIRSDALSALAHLRPMTALAAQTLEKAAEHDAAWRNRVQAKTASIRYNLTFRPGKDADAPAVAGAAAMPARTPVATSSGLPPIRNFEPPLAERPGNGPELTPGDTIPNFRPVPGSVPTKPVPPSDPSTSRFIPLPKFGDPKVADGPDFAPTPTGPSIAPEAPRPAIAPPKGPAPVLVAPANPADEIVIPVLPGPSLAPAPAIRAPVVPIPTPMPESGPVLIPLPTPPASPAPPQAPRTPVRPMPDDEVPLPPKF